MLLQGFSTNILYSENHVGQHSFPIKQASIDIMQLMKDLTEVREIEFLPESSSTRYNPSISFESASSKEFEDDYFV